MVTVAAFDGLELESCKFLPSDKNGRNMSGTKALVAEACFFGEFGLRGARWLAGSSTALWLLPCITAFAGIVSVVLGHLAGVNGAALLFHVHGAKSAEYRHPFGYIAEGNFALWMIVGLPIAVFIAIQYGRSAGKAISNVKAEPVERGRFPHAAKFVFRKQSGIRMRTALIASFVLLCGYHVCTQIGALHEASVLESTSIASIKQWDFGTYQIPYLKGVSKSFNDWDAATKAKFLAEERPRYLLQLADAYFSKTDKASLVDWRQKRDEQGPRDALLNEHAEFELGVVAANGMVPKIGLRYYVFLIFSQVLNAFGHWLALWVILKLFVWFVVIRQYLPSESPPSRFWPFVVDDEELCLGFKGLWKPFDWLLYAGLLGGLYISLQKATPAYWQALGIAGRGNVLTLVVNLAIVFSLAVGASFAQWVILKRRLTPIWKNAEEELGAAATLEGANIPGVWRCQSSLQRSHVIARNQSVYPKIEWRVGVLKIVATFVLGISISLDGIPNFVRSKLDALATKMYDLDGPEILAGKKIP